MVIIKEVKTLHQRIQFINFQIKLYKGNKHFVPPLYIDEFNIFTKKNPYLKTCDFVFYLAYKNNKIVGRIGGILQKASNEIRNEKRVRFTRFDCINDQEVANKLFEAVESWAKEKGMDTICGPLGFSDLEREGLLIEGFDEPSTFEEQYNYDYYQKLIENNGYEKEVDWFERRLYKSESYDARLEKITDRLLERYQLRYSDCKNIGEFIKLYSDKLFKLLDETYKDLYQTVPFTEEMKKSIISTFRLATDIKHTNVIVDKDDNVVCFGVSFPSMSEAIRKSNGHITVPELFRLIKAIKHPKVYDLGLIGVADEYKNTGIAASLIVKIQKMLNEENYDYIETNLCLENNTNISRCWEHFNYVLCKKRRAFIKKI